MKTSVILCTYNPDPRLLDWTLDSLARQTMRDFEMVVVDNNSSTPLDQAALRNRHGLDLRVLREPRQGLSHARCLGIAETSGDLLVFVDDDNHLFPDYLAQAASIAVRNPGIGHFGGAAIAELESPIPEWKKKLLPYLGVRDYGQEPITSSEDRWGEWEPIGAGMATRRPVAQRFVEMVRDNGGERLGRRGIHLMSGEDSLMARAANREGFACSYQPSLRLRHFMKRRRLRVSVLARTLEGHGRSYVVLERVLGRSVDVPRPAWILRELPLRLLYRIRREGLAAGAVSWFWDLGYVREALRG